MHAIDAAIYGQNVQGDRDVPSARQTTCLACTEIEAGKSRRGAETAWLSPDLARNH